MTPVTDKVILRDEALSRSLARSHYENFTVASWILPPRLRQDFFNVYAFCRLADDLADESDDPARSELLLNRWEELLNQAGEGGSKEPPFAALGETIRRRNLSLEPFRNLLTAFRMDLQKRRWKNWEELKEYTRHSADPVGRIVLELFGLKNPDYFAHSDKICTALQLANHWQDVAEDWERGRIYLPEEDLIRFRVTEEQIASRRMSIEFEELMMFEVKRARDLFREGYQLLKEVRGVLRIQLALYWGGGMAVLDRIERIGWDVLNSSAKLTAGDRWRVVWFVIRVCCSRSNRLPKWVS